MAKTKRSRKAFQIEEVEDRQGYQDAYGPPDPCVMVIFGAGGDLTGRQLIPSLYELALKQKAFAALVELQWFISEQVEEEKTAREIVGKFQMVKDDPASMLDLDR